jgi:hypothetical protein
MKRFVIFVVLVFFACGLTFAQYLDRNALQAQKEAQKAAIRQSVQVGYKILNKNPPPQDVVYNVPGPVKQIISGVLGVGRGMVTLNDKKGVAWYVLGLDRFIGFIDGLDLGQEVELEGYAPAVPGSSQERFFQAVKLTLDGMSYDLTPLPESTPVPVQPSMNYKSTSLPEGSWVTIQSRGEPIPAQPKSRGSNHVSPWAPNNDRWMQNLDLNAIWDDDSTFWQHNSRDVRDRFFD